MDFYSFLKLNNKKKYQNHAMDGVEDYESHDKRYHPKGYQEGDYCKLREKEGEKDSVDDLINSGITVFHGTNDIIKRFSTDKIGDGKGYKIYGHGIYMAFNRETAERYARARMEERITKDLHFDFNKDKYRPKTADPYERKAAEDIMRATKETNGNINAAVYKVYADYMGGYDERSIRLMDALNKIDKTRFFSNIPRKAMKQYLYKVKIPKDNGKNYYDKDKELPRWMAKQFAKVNGADGDIHNMLPYVDNGMDFYEELSTVMGSPKKASDYLAANGVVGMRYNTTDDGNCVVVYDDSKIKMDKKETLKGALDSLDNEANEDEYEEVYVMEP